MRFFNVLVAVTILQAPGIAHGATVVAATNAERDSGFDSIADCERSLGVSGGERVATAEKGQAVLRGSLFNRAAGNISRCETVAGEVQVVVYPKGSSAAAD